ncbi:ATP-binding cassette domain-containing protein [Nocardioides zeae]
MRDAERRLEVAEREALPKPRPPLRFAGALTAGSDGDGPVVRARGIDVPGRLALDRLDVAAGASLLVTGPNGCGKSTLLAVLAGELPAGGALDVRARTVRLLRQDPEVTHPRRTARAAYLAAVGAALAERVPLRALGLLPPRAHATPVGALSVGQRRRLDLAIAIAAAPDLLLLDEPTNHLSLGLAGSSRRRSARRPGRSS